jgi:hypothetical protein
MLVVYTSYDAVTGILGRVAQDFANENPKFEVLADSGSGLSTNHRISDSVGIDQLLRARQRVALFFFGHGCPTPAALIGQDRLAAIHDKNLDLLQGRVVCAVACYSWNILQGDAGSRDYSLLGYAGPLQVPLLPQYYDRFRSCLLAGPKLLLTGHDSEGASNAAAQEFERVAIQLIMGPVLDQVMATMVFRPNAKGVRFAGNSRTL